MIDKFSHGFINSVYKFNDFTLNELICKLAQKMDEVIAQSNESFNYLDWLKGQGLSDEVIKKMLEWKEDGTLETLINETIFNGLNTKIDNLKVETNSHLNNKANVVCFEQFGETGTGDDTIVLQKCINYAKGKNILIQASPGLTYNVSQLVIDDSLYIDWNHCKLKGISERPVIYVDKQGNMVSGEFKNLIIDCNNISKKAILINEDWRRIYDNIYIENLPHDGIGIDTTNLGLGGCLFNNIRGYGAKRYETTLMKINSADSVVKNVDYQNFKYGIEVNANTIFENIHGYIAYKEIYENSYFMKINAPIQGTNLYPDTQHRQFIITSSFAVTLTGITTWFNSDTINPSEFSTPYIFYTEQENYLNRMFINNSAFRTPSAIKTYEICNIESPRLNLSSCICTGNISEPNYKGFVNSLNSSIFKSNLLHRNNGDTLIFGGYYDVIGTTGTSGEIGVFSIANDFNHRFLNTRIFLPYGYMDGNNFVYEGLIQCIVKNNTELYIVPKNEMNGKRFYIQGLVAYRESKNVAN